MIGSPRPHIGADINTSGNTSDGYFGLGWGIVLIQSLFGVNDGMFANGSLGGAVHDGYIDTAPAGRKRLGSRACSEKAPNSASRSTRAPASRRWWTISRMPIWAT